MPGTLSSGDRRLSVSPVVRLEGQRCGALGGGSLEGEGYVIPFRMLPPLSPTLIIMDSYFPQSVKGKALEEEIQALRRKGVVEPAPPTPGFYSRMFVVTKATGGWRPIIDLSSLNLSVDRTPFGWRPLRRFFVLFGGTTGWSP